jgi:hypothetical protein
MAVPDEILEHMSRNQVLESPAGSPAQDVAARFLAGPADRRGALRRMAARCPHKRLAARRRRAQGRRPGADPAPRDVAHRARLPPARS